MISKKAQVHLEHVIFNSYKTFLQKDISSSAKLVVAVSGGKDSMALLKAMTQVFPKSQMVVAHFHHGDFFNKEFRDQALSLVQKFCTSEYLLLEYEKSLDFLKSESDCRKARMDFFSRLMTKHNSSVLVLAHHLDDWLETQLIKLIRGCSFESLNQNLELSTFLIDAVKIYKWRPWIRTMQREILEYVNEKKISFVEDPTNSKKIYFRNWLRQQWLPELEQHRAGSKKALAFSLIHSLETLKVNSRKKLFPWNWLDSSISRLFWESLDSQRQKQCLAYFFYKKKFTAVRRTQIEEIIKQLDKSKNEHTLSFKTFDVVVNAERVSILQRNTKSSSS